MLNAVQIVHTDVLGPIKPFRAEVADTDSLSQLMLDTARWLNSRGSSQWEGLLSGQDSHNMTEAVKRGDVFAFREEGKSEWAGMMILQWNPSAWDYRLWGNEDGLLEDAVYIHRVVVNRAYAGTGLGSAMLKWAETGARYPGKKWLRLDCIASNEALNRFYPACGYQFVREADGFHLYDLPLSAS